jgi:hypothetical protein
MKQKAPRGTTTEYGICCKRRILIIALIKYMSPPIHSHLFNIRSFKVLLVDALFKKYDAKAAMHVMIITRR